MSTTSLQALPVDSAVPGVVRLTVLHAKYNLIETFRTPIAVIGGLVFPALALLFFVVPNRVVAESPVYATEAIISMSVLAVMTNGLFSLGLTISEGREKSWDPYLRTLPASGLSRVLAQVFSTGALGLVATIPVVIVCGLITAAEASVARIGFGLIALAIALFLFRRDEGRRYR